MSVAEIRQLRELLAALRQCEDIAAEIRKNGTADTAYFAGLCCESLKSLIADVDGPISVELDR